MEWSGALGGKEKWSRRNHTSNEFTQILAKYIGVCLCVLGTVYLPSPKCAGASDQQRQQPIHLVCQLLCSGEDGLPGRHGR